MEYRKEIGLRHLNNINNNSCVEDTNEHIINYHITIHQLMGMVLSLIHSMCVGILAGFASIIVTQLKETQEFIINKNEATWIASIVIIPTAASSLLAGFLLTKLSKKTLFILVSLIELISWLIIFQSTSITVLLIGRTLNGMSSAMTSPIIPSYLGEILHPNMRGFGLSLINLGIAIGLLVIHLLGAFFTWRLCALFAAFILFCYLCLMICLKETYVWHMKHNNIEEAKKSFYWYRGKNEDAHIELQKIIHKQREDKVNATEMPNMMNVYFSKLLLMPFFISAIGMLTMHLSGYKIIIFYSIGIVSKVIPSLNQYTSTIIVDTFRIGITLVACYLINKYPIRTLFISSGLGSAISLFTFSTFNYFAQNYTDEGTTKMFSILALITLLIYIVFSSMGLAPLAWVIVGEIFPMTVKNIGTGLCSFVYFGTFFIVLQVSPSLIDGLGISGVFLLFAVCTLVGTLIMYFVLPETRNKTLKEIEDMFR